MTTSWIENLFSGSNVVVTLGSATTTGMITQLSSLMSGIIPAILPTIISVTVLFTFYHILKSLYHARF